MRTEFIRGGFSEKKIQKRKEKEKRIFLQKVHREKVKERSEFEGEAAETVKVDLTFTVHHLPQSTSAPLTAPATLHRSTSVPPRRRRSL